jgi:hypothetical protein
MNDAYDNAKTDKEMLRRFAEHRAVTIALDDGRAVNVDSGGHVTVWDADGEVEGELDV